MTTTELVAALNQKFPDMHFAQIQAARFAKILHNDSVFCFIDADGGVYKAASWKAAAKGIRSTLATVDTSIC